MIVIDRSITKFFETDQPKGTDIHFFQQTKISCTLVIVAISIVTTNCASLTSSSHQLPITPLHPKESFSDKIILRAKIRNVRHGVSYSGEMQKLFPFQLVHSGEGERHIFFEPKISNFSDKDPAVDLILDLITDEREIDSNSIWPFLLTLGFYPRKFHNQITVVARVQNKNTGKLTHYFEQGWVKYSLSWIPQSETKTADDAFFVNQMQDEFLKVIAEKISKDVYAH